mgnify:CR=1 FL=1
MKRILPLIFPLFLLIFGGCKSTHDRNGDRPPDIPTAFTAEIYIIRGEREYEAKYDQTSLAEAPATVRGLKVTLNGSKCTLGYGNLTFSADLSSLPQSGVGELITKTLKTSSDTANTQTVHMGDAWETKGTVSGVDFTLRRGDNGLPQSLEIPKALLTAEFRNVSPK